MKWNLFFIHGVAGARSDWKADGMEALRLSRPKKSETFQLFLLLLSFCWIHEAFLRNEEKGYACRRPFNQKERLSLIYFFQFELKLSEGNRVDWSWLGSKPITVYSVIKENLDFLYEGGNQPFHQLSLHSTNSFNPIKFNWLCFIYWLVSLKLISLNIITVC